MAGVTDSAFRQMAKEGGADVVYSEMASVAALVHNSGKTLEMLKAAPRERPYVVQLFGADPKHFAIAARLVEEKIGPDGLDINFGCPVKKVQKQGAGAVLMENLDLSRKVVESVLANTALPVSVKCRTAVGRVKVKEFLEKIADLDVEAVMIHGRAMSQGHSGEIDTEAIKNARQSFKGLVLANGGVRSWEDAYDLLEKTGADGVGVARGALGRPWIFSEIREKETFIKNKEEIFALIREQARLAEATAGRQGIIELRKHLCWYVAGLPDASELRRQFVLIKTLEDIEAIIKAP